MYGGKDLAIGPENLLHERRARSVPEMVLTVCPVVLDIRDSSVMNCLFFSQLGGYEVLTL